MCLYKKKSCWTDWFISISIEPPKIRLLSESTLTFSLKISRMTPPSKNSSVRPSSLAKSDRSSLNRWVLPSKLLQVNIDDLLLTRIIHRFLCGQQDPNRLCVNFLASQTASVCSMNRYATVLRTAMITLMKPQKTAVSLFFFYSFLCFFLLFSSYLVGTVRLDCLSSRLPYTTVGVCIL